MKRSTPLAYRFSFLAPPETSPDDLETFLKSVGEEARTLGFGATVERDVRIDRKNIRDNYHYLSGCPLIQSKKARFSFSPEEAWHTSFIDDSLRLLPERSVLLLLTGGPESKVCLGFMKFPRELHDRRRDEVVKTPSDDCWIFDDFINSHDPRYRLLVNRFTEAGYLKSELDEFASATQNELAERNENKSKLQAEADCDCSRCGHYVLVQRQMERFGVAVTEIGCWI